MFGNRPLSRALRTAFFALALAFTAYVLPGLPPFEWPPEWGPVPELAQAQETYLLRRTEFPPARMSLISAATAR